MPVPRVPWRMKQYLTSWELALVVALTTSGLMFLVAARDDLVKIAPSREDAAGLREVGIQRVQGCFD